jgi:hypothetical protein
MRVDFSLLREPSDRIAPGGPVLSVPRTRGRPEVRYRLRIRGPADATAARKLGLPVHLVTEELVAAFRFPMTLEPVVVVWDPLLGALQSELRVQSFASRSATLAPRVEDLVIVLLRVDPFAARAVALRNREFVDATRLLERVIEEHVTREATEVGLQEVAPGIPERGARLPARLLAQQDRNAVTVGLL